MAGRKIVWTNRANSSFNHIIEYIFTNFGEKAAMSFVQNTYNLIEILALYPNLGTLEDLVKGIHGFVISKQNTLFYRVTDQEIIILNIFGNRKNPKRKTF